MRTKRSRRFLLAGILVVLSLAGSTLVATTPAQAQRPPVQIAQARGTLSLCLNRQGGSTAIGTHITGWSCNDPNDDFLRRHMTICNNGWVSSTCPFEIGSGLNSFYLNSAIVLEERSGLGPGDFVTCVGSTHGFSAAILTDCPGLDGVCHVNNSCWGTIMILPQVKCCDYFNHAGDVSYTVDRYWSDATNVKRWQCVYAKGNQVTLGSPTGDAGYCEWREA
jgi:hypothetical protein